MRVAIDRVLEQPHWLDSIRSRLRVGQSVTYAVRAGVAAGNPQLAGPMPV